jgi:hypothetical protein
MPRRKFSFFWSKLCYLARQSLNPGEKLGRLGRIGVLLPDRVICEHFFGNHTKSSKSEKKLASPGGKTSMLNHLPGDLRTALAIAADKAKLTDLYPAKGIEVGKLNLVLVDPAVARGPDGNTRAGEPRARSGAPGDHQCQWGHFSLTAPASPLFE